MGHRKLSPVIIVGLTALAVAGASLVAGAFGLFAKTVDPRVTLQLERGQAGRQPPVALQSGLAMKMDGEVAHTAQRIGEATALALSASLYASSEQLKGRTPRSVRDLLAGVAQKGLLPPGLVFTNMDGTLASAYGTLAVRYRLTPLAIEVVSIGSKPEDGPALIVRVPDETSDKGEAELYIAGRLTGVTVPAPFAPASEVIALGWNPERLRSLK
jgi:hypothetical protein